MERGAGEVENHCQQENRCKSDMALPPPSAHLVSLDSDQEHLPDTEPCLCHALQKSRAYSCPVRISLSQLLLLIVRTIYDGLS